MRKYPLNQTVIPAITGNRRCGTVELLIHFQGSKSEVKNYRPINVASTFVNLEEKMMNIQMYNFWCEKGILHNMQFGFRKNHSVGQLINSAKKDLIRKDKKYSCIILTDLSNAFGSCDRHIILKRMAPFLSTNALRLLRSFLIQPQVQVIQNGKISKPFSCSDRGYSQGSNLSTFLFICLMRLSHNLPKKIDSYSFADDDQLIISSNSVKELEKDANEAIKFFHDFCNSHNIKLNCKKTLYCLNGNFTKKEKEDFKIETYGETIERVDEINMLGVVLSNKLEF